ncbi:MAG: hypothetical protein HY231_02915 [Acidobacteria bacterium]|nr:hypothetical protein [Acidobacteriota bacterium]
MNQLSLKACATFFLLALLLLGSFPRAQASVYRADALPALQFLPVADGDGFVVYATDEGAHCVEATTDEEKFLTRGDLSNDLHIISPPKLLAADGLTVTLRATSQLEGFPDAKAAFLRAAASWEAIIKSPITIIVDVDYGPNRFGTPFPTGVLGSTASQSLRDATGYSRIRSKLITYATSDAEKALVNALPSTQLPSDYGNATSVTAPSALWRALGELPAVANPTVETDIGAVPSVGFNSAFSYDFDPSNGIDAGKLDFQAVATHEIGHALGFTSVAGSQSGAPNATIWDFFRFPTSSITLSSFTTAPRNLLAGGAPVFFNGNTPLMLSTGATSAGGDGRQTSHWKDDQLTGTHIGIMDPTLPDSRKFVITDNDIAALDTMGYQLKAGASGGGGGGGGGGGDTGAGTAPSTSQFAASLNGDVLALTGVAADNEGDVRQAQITLLNSANAVVNTGAPFDVNFGVSTQSSFTLNFSNLSAYPTAMQVSLVFIDSKGNRSQAVSADFSKADTGGANLMRATFETSEGVLTLKGTGFVVGMQIEINGVTVTASKVKIKSGGAKAVIFGSTSALNLRSGANRLRVRTAGLRSNLLVLTL